MLSFLIYTACLVFSVLAQGFQPTIRSPGNVNVGETRNIEWSISRGLPRDETVRVNLRSKSNSQPLWSEPFTIRRGTTSGTFPITFTRASSQLFIEATNNGISVARSNEFEVRQPASPPPPPPPPAPPVPQPTTSQGPQPSNSLPPNVPTQNPPEPQNPTPTVTTPGNQQPTATDSTPDTTPASSTTGNSPDPTNTADDANTAGSEDITSTADNGSLATENTTGTATGSITAGGRVGGYSSVSEASTTVTTTDSAGSTYTTVIPKPTAHASGEDDPSGLAPTGAAKASNTGAIVGGVVGGSVVLILVILILVRVQRKARAKKIERYGATIFNRDLMVRPPSDSEINHTHSGINTYTTHNNNPIYASDKPAQNNDLPLGNYYDDEKPRGMGRY